MILKRDSFSFVFLLLFFFCILTLFLIFFFFYFLLLLFLLVLLRSLLLSTCWTFIFLSVTLRGRVYCFPDQIYLDLTDLVRLWELVTSGPNRHIRLKSPGKQARTEKFV